jgi:hypothetical protein
MITNKFLDKLETQFYIEDHKSIYDQFEFLAQFRPQFFNKNKITNIKENLITNFLRLKQDFKFDTDILFKPFTLKNFHFPTDKDLPKKIEQICNDLEEINNYYHRNCKNMIIGGMYDKNGPKLVICILNNEDDIEDIVDVFTIQPGIFNFFNI